MCIINQVKAKCELTLVCEHWVTLSLADSKVEDFSLRLKVWSKA